MTRTRSVAKHATVAQTRDDRARAKVAKELGGTHIGAATTDSFVNFAAKLGIGADNVMSGSNYSFNPITRNRILLEWIYRGSWIAGVAVDLIADDMTRAGVTFKTDLLPDQQTLLEEKVVELDIWNKVNETLKWGRLYGGSIAVMMIDGQDLRTPVNIDTVGPGQFKGLAVFDRWMLEPSLEDLVTEYGPMCGTPRYYRVLPNAPYMQGKAIHCSRIVMRPGGIKLPYQQALVENLWDLSIIERLYDRLVAFDSATTGTAQLVYKSYLRTLKVKGLREIVSMGNASQALMGLTQYVQMMAKYQGIEGVTLVDGEDEYTSEHHGAFSGLADTLLQFGQQISGALQIPLVRLFGQSPAGLNSTGESDLRTYYDHIKQQQVKTMKVGITMVYKVIAQSLGIILPQDFRLDFKPLWELSDDDKAGIAERITNAITAAFEGGFISQQVAMKELLQSSDITGVFTNITEEDIAAADSTLQPPGLGEMGGDYLPMPGSEGEENAQTAGPAGNPAQVDGGPQGRSPVQQQAALPSPAGGGNSQGARPRRFLQLGAESSPSAPGIQRRTGSLGGISGGANASGRF